MSHSLPFFFFPPSALPESLSPLLYSCVAAFKFVYQGWGPLLLPLFSPSSASFLLLFFGIMHMEVTVGDSCENVAVYFIEISIHKVMHRNVMP